MGEEGGNLVQVKQARSLLKPELESFVSVVHLGILDSSSALLVVVIRPLQNIVRYGVFHTLLPHPCQSDQKIVLGWTVVLFKRYPAMVPSVVYMLIATGAVTL